MILKNTIYPKTLRFSGNVDLIQITEKIDGSNLCLFKFNGELYVAQRNYIFSFKTFLTDRDSVKGILYKGLGEFLEKYGKDIENKLSNDCAICGEWIGMGQIKYSDRFDGNFLLFASAKVFADIGGRFSLYDIVYDRELISIGKDEVLPEYLGLVPLVAIKDKYPTLDELNYLYDLYSNSVSSVVEGFVIHYKNNIKKYVRYKNGKLEEHRM